MARPQKRPRSRSRSHSPEPVKRRRSGRIQALAESNQAGEGSGGGGGGGKKSKKGSSGSAKLVGNGTQQNGQQIMSTVNTAQNIAQRPMTTANEAQLRPQQPMQTNQGHHNTQDAGHRPATPSQRNTIRAQPQPAPTSTPPTPASSPSTSSSDESFNDASNPAVSLIHAQEELVQIFRSLAGPFSFLGRTMYLQLREILATNPVPHVGRGMVQRIRDVGGVPRNVPWDFNSVMNGVTRPQQVLAMHFFSQSTIRSNRERLRLTRHRVENSLLAAVRPPPSIPVDPSLLLNTRGIVSPQHSADQASGRTVRLTNLHRREDGLYVITIPGSDDFIAVMPDTTVFYKRQNGEVFRIPPQMVQYLLAKLRASNRMTSDMPSARRLAHQDETRGKIEELKSSVHDGKDMARPLRRETYAPGAFNLIDALIRHPAVFQTLVQYLPASALVFFYSTSKLFQYLFNSDYERYIRSNLDYHELSDRIFPWRCFAKLCIFDPVGRSSPDDPDHAKIIPGLKYLSMVHSHLETAKEIRQLLINKVRGIPEICVQVMLKISFLMILPSNASRIGLMHNKSYWGDDDLLHAWLLIIKLDMALNRNPLSRSIINPRSLRQRLFQSKSLRLMRDALKDGRYYVKRRAQPVIGREEVPKKLFTQTLVDIEREVHIEHRLLRPDQLIIQEGYARGLNMCEYNMAFMLHGW